MERGELLAADPLLAARQLISLLQPKFMLRLWNVSGPAARSDPAADANAAVDTFLRAYAPSG
jgi:hypothetical protein